MIPLGYKLVHNPVNYRSSTQASCRSDVNHYEYMNHIKHYNDYYQRFHIITSTKINHINRLMMNQLANISSMSWLPVILTYHISLIDDKEYQYF